MNQNSIEKARMFELFDSEQIHRLFEQLHPQHLDLQKGELLIYDGQIVDFFAIVESGELIATKLYSDGKQSLIAKYVPSYIVGVDIAATKKQVSTCYITASKNSRVYVIPYEKIAHPGSIDEPSRLTIMESILALIAGENLKKMAQIEIISRKGLRDRILTFLSIQRSFFGSDEFEIPYNREELADYLCVNRSALSHELRVMESENLIYCRKNKFQILDAELYERHNLSQWEPNLRLR